MRLEPRREGRETVPEAVDEWWGIGAGVGRSELERDCGIAWGAGSLGAGIEAEGGSSELKRGAGSHR